MGEPSVDHTDDTAERKRRRIGRPSKAEPFRDLVRSLLADDPALVSPEVLRRAKVAGYAGSKSAMCALIAGQRPARPKPIVRFEGLPGEFSQHDFGQVDVPVLLAQSAVDRFKNAAFDFVIEGEPYRPRLMPRLVSTRLCRRRRGTSCR